MGFLGILGKIGKGALNVATGGIGGSILDAAAALAGGRQQGRETDAAFQQRQDQLAQHRYGNQIDATKVNLQAPSIRAGQSVRGDILANAKPFTWTGGSQSVNGIPVPQFSGGLSPEMFSANTRALGSQMSAQALKDNGAMGGRAIGDAPGLTGLPQPGVFDKILQTAGTIGALTSAIPYQTKKNGVASTYQPDDENGWG